jgi:hypothetical protein
VRARKDSSTLTCPAAERLRGFFAIRAQGCGEKTSKLRYGYNSYEGN